MKVGIIGCGVMGKALAKHFGKEHSVFIFDKSSKQEVIKAEQIKAEMVLDLEDLFKHANIIVLAVKPKDLREIAKKSSCFFSKDHLLISILAGVSLATLKKYFPKCGIVRAMPNLALAFQQSVIGLTAHEDTPEEMKVLTIDLLKDLGLVFWLIENKIDALSALSASSIAFIFIIIEAMTDAGLSLGFSANDAQNIAIQTIEGATALLKGLKKHPAEAKAMITSPGGTTIAGLKVLEDKGVRAGIWDAILAAYERNIEMKKEAENE